ncbi:MAG: PIN domain-containing protein [Promethearchaeota archaeon]
MILLDTNVIIDIGRGRSNIEKCIYEFKNEESAISAITIQELHVGLGYTLQKRGEKQYKINKEKTQKLIEGFRVLNITRPILERAGFIKEN